jgi:hypothetical protein
MTDLKTLQAQLAQIEAQIAETKKAAKTLKKLQACKLNHHTAHKYFDLQAAYMAAVKGN